MTIRTQLTAGGLLANHSEALTVRTAVKAGGITEITARRCASERRPPPSG